MDTRTEQQLDIEHEIATRAASARSADPRTSKAAAASVRGLAASHRRILALFERYGDMTDETLGKLLDELAAEKIAPKMSPSGIRSRRSDLSKPNMRRLDQIAVDLACGADLAAKAFADLDAYWQDQARTQLRREGFRGIDGEPTTRPTLWDTGKREPMATGRQAIVWGIAR